MQADYRTCKPLTYDIKVYFHKFVTAMFLLSLESPLCWNTAVEIPARWRQCPSSCQNGMQLVQIKQHPEKEEVRESWQGRTGSLPSIFIARRAEGYQVLTATTA